MFVIPFLMTIAFFMLVAIYVTIIKRLFISRIFSEKLSINILIVLFCFINFICYMYVMLVGFISLDLLDALKLHNKAPLDVIKNMQYLLDSINSMSIFLSIGIVFYLATILLIKQIKKDIDKEINKPKGLWDWSKINNKQ